MSLTECYAKTTRLERFLQLCDRAFCQLLCWSEPILRAADRWIHSQALTLSLSTLLRLYFCLLPVCICPPLPLYICDIIWPLASHSLCESRDVDTILLRGQSSEVRSTDNPFSLARWWHGWCWWWQCSSDMIMWWWYQLWWWQLWWWQWRWWWWPIIHRQPFRWPWWGRLNFGIFFGKETFFLEEKEIYISEAHLQKNSLKNVFWSEFERQFPG